MKKLAILFIVMFVSSAVVFADEGELTRAQPKKVITSAVLKMEDPDYVTGKVVDIIPSDRGRSRAQITISDRDGAEYVFDVKVLAVIYDGKGNLLSLDEIALGSEVEAHYRMLASGKREATSIRVLR
ncbi:MAG: hypothetical protein NC938_06655 [Candidatus Omnitrophica bacterium]|nr:hypothetical protein [Candidatus Omnitrophota bacterium]MCM8791357.1 hypothetical protein [Candidatus Omnitrophota bacterium]